MTHIMKGDPESTIIREFNGDEMKAVSINCKAYQPTKLLRTVAQYPAIV